MTQLDNFKIKTQSMEQKKISLHLVLIASIILALIELLTAGVIINTDVSPLIAIGFARIAEIAAMVFILLRWRNGLESIGLHKDTIVTGFRRGILWSASFGICALLILGVLLILDYNLLHIFQTPAQKSLIGIFLLLVVGALISPVAEEIFFRGIVYGYLRRRNAILAILGSTTLFCMVHFFTTGLSFIQLIGGLVFAIAYEMEKNLLVPITIHVLGNMAIFILSIMLAL